MSFRCPSGGHDRGSRCPQKNCPTGRGTGLGAASTPAAFNPDPIGGSVGEFWFADGDGDHAQLLVKYIFTSERLSIQVHPDDDAARARSFAREKDEAWYILEAEPGAVIGLGLTDTASKDALRAAALYCSIEQLIDCARPKPATF